MSGQLEKIMVVLHPFGRYTKGDIIDDPTEMEAVLSAGQSSFVVTAAKPVTTGKALATKTVG